MTATPITEFPGTIKSAGAVVETTAGAQTKADAAQAAAIAAAATDATTKADSAQAAAIAAAAAAAPELARDAVGTALTQGTGITITPNDDADTITVATTAYIPGGTDVPITDGGTGASDVSTARFNLGVVKSFSHAPATAIAETFPRNSAFVDGTVLTSGTLRLTAVWLEAGQTATNITFLSSTTPLSGGSNQWFSLYSPARALLRVTSDDTSTAWGSNTAKTLALSSSYLVPTSGLYYVGIVVVASQVPTLNSLSSSSVRFGIAPILTGNSTGSLTNPASAPDPAAAITASGIMPYAYVT